MIRAYIDTNFAVAFFVATHPHHARALSHPTNTNTGQRYGIHACRHTIGESYATLSNPRYGYGLSLGEIRKLCNALIPNLIDTHDPTADDYERALDLALELHLTSGAIYDALHLACAERLGCTELWTFNEKHFRRFAPLTDVAIVVPAAEP